MNKKFINSYCSAFDLYHSGYILQQDYEANPILVDLASLKIFEELYVLFLRILTR